MRPVTGMLLRLLGPLIELVCVGLLLAVRGQGRTVLGMPLEYPLFAGLAVGLAMVIAGLTLVKRNQTADRATPK